MGTRRTWVLCSLVALALAVPAPASAGFSAAELSCREKLSKDGGKLSDKASKTMVKCHKLRSAGKLPSSTNCNSIVVADTKGVVLKTANKLVSDANATCTGLTPSNLDYTGCPSPCDSMVPSISTFQDVADCIVCVAENHAQSVSVNGQGNPSTPLLKDEAKCHGAIGTGQSKLMRRIVKERSKCQTAAERAGATDTASCISADPDGKIQKTQSTARDKLTKTCTGVSLSSLDSCSFFSLNNLEDCVLDEARVRGRLTFKSFYELAPGGGVTTTTFVSTTTVSGGTTTTTMPSAQDPQCPNKGQLTLLAGTGDVCSTNGDCLAGTCDTGLGHCVTQSELDTGWTGISHDSDVNDLTQVMGELVCPGPGPTCGQCDVIGLLPDFQNCRCRNNNRNVCDKPFAADATNCGVSNNTCDCYFGAPLPLSAGNTPACAVNRFAVDISGTANVDTGAGKINANLKSLVYLGESLVQPCPSCGGTCTAPAGKVGNGCGTDIDCDTSAGSGDGVCGNYDPTPGDGNRGGRCFLGDNDGQSCDVGAPNRTFPAPGGGGSSLDCFPAAGKGVSGTGLTINLVQTTGTSALPSAALSCAFGFGLCPCGQCTGDTSVGCTANADCVAASVSGPCVTAAESPNQCDDGVCSDAGGGEGQCLANLQDKYCDAIVRANGEGFISCQGNADCAPLNIGIAAGNCTLTKTRECFLNPITATGVQDASKPLAVATFCVPKTSNSGINTVAGLPGPGRIKSQAVSKLFCASNPAVQYQPGIGGCP